MKYIWWGKWHVYNCDEKKIIEKEIGFLSNWELCWID